MLEEKYMYVSSDGTKKDVRQLDFQYLVNAVAKAHRNVIESNNLEDYKKNAKNIEILENELFERRNNYFLQLISRGEN